MKTKLERFEAENSKLKEVLVADKPNVAELEKQNLALIRTLEEAGKSCRSFVESQKSMLIKRGSLSTQT